MNANSPAPPDALPVNIEAEQAFLGAALVNNDVLALVSGFLEPRHFSEALHARIYSIMLELAGNGQRATVVTVKTFLAEVILPHNVTVQAYLARLSAEATTIINAPDYAGVIVDLWQRREIIRLAQDAAEAARCAEISSGPVDILDDLDASLIDLRNSGRQSSVERSTLAGGADDLLADIETVRRGDAPPVPTSGFADINRAIGGGLRPGRLVVVAGRPGMGKSVLMCAMARRAARKGFGVDIYSLEIDRRELTARLMANALAPSVDPIDYRDLLIGNVGDAILPRLRELRDQFAELPMSIDATPGLKISQIESRAKRTAMRLERAGKRLDVVFIDYLGLVGASERYKGRKVDEMGEVVLGAKNMAKRLGVCVVMLAQLNRGVESRDCKRPLMSDLRDSGNIEEHADAVGLLYRPAYYDAKDPRMTRDADFMVAAAERHSVLEVIFDKNRLGPTGKVVLYCDVARSFVDNGERKW
jgi:replicative DNA helicase